MIADLLDALRRRAARTSRREEAMLPPGPALASFYLLGEQARVAELEGRRPRVVGVAAWAATADPAVAKALLLTAPGWRSGPTGPQLTRGIVDGAVASGVERFLAEMAPHNSQLRAAMRALGLPELRVPEDAGFGLLFELRLEVSPPPRPGR